MSQDFEITMTCESGEQWVSWIRDAKSPEDALGRWLRRKYVVEALMGEQAWSFVVKDQWTAVFDD